MRPATLLGFHNLPWTHNYCQIPLATNLCSTGLAAKGGGSDTHILYPGATCVSGARFQA